MLCAHRKHTLQMVNYTEINAYLVKNNPDTETEDKKPRSSKKIPCSCGNNERVYKQVKL